MTSTTEQAPPVSEPAGNVRERIAERAYGAMTSTVLKTIGYLNEQADGGDTAAFAAAVVKYGELAALPYDQAATEHRERARAFADEVLALSVPTPGFDAARHLTKVTGRDYLEVKWRLVWLRSQHPDARVETALITHPTELDGSVPVVFRATVTLPNGATATGYGSETLSDHSDYIEKAETKAIGRALAVLGFGTQFSIERESVVDAPVEGTRGRQRAQAAAAERAGTAYDEADQAMRQAAAPPRRPAGGQRKPATTGATATYCSEFQKRRVEKLRVSLGMSEKELAALIREMYSDRATLERLSVASANDLIAELEAGRWPLDQAEAAKIVAAGERAAAAGERLATAAPAPAVYENPLDDDDATDVPFVPAGSEPTEAERTRDQLATIDDLVRRLGATPADLDNVVYKRYQCTTAELDEHKRLDLIAHLSKRAAEHTPA